MAKKCLPRLLVLFPIALLILPALSLPLFAQESKILGGYFEEWGIYYAGYNIANLQQNGAADKLTHLFYAFANVTTTSAPACAIADSWADYRTPYLPSVSGAAYTGPMYGNFAAIQQLKELHPKLKVLMAIGGASAANTAAFAAAASNAADRQALVSSCIDMSSGAISLAELLRRDCLMGSSSIGSIRPRAIRRTLPRCWPSSAVN